MDTLNGELAGEVRSFLESGDRKFLETLGGLDANDIQGQAVIRYLMNIKHWPLTPDSDFSSLLERFFAHREDRPSITPEEYRERTGSLIREAFSHECVYAPPEPRPEKPEAKAPAKRATKSRMQSETDSVEEGESGSRTFKTMREQEES